MTTYKHVADNCLLRGNVQGLVVSRNVNHMILGQLHGRTFATVNNKHPHYLSILFLMWTLDNYLVKELFFSMNVNCLNIVANLYLWKRHSLMIAINNYGRIMKAEQTGRAAQRVLTCEANAAHAPLGRFWAHNISMLDRAILLTRTITHVTDEIRINYLTVLIR